MMPRPGEQICLLVDREENVVVVLPEQFLDEPQVSHRVAPRNGAAVHLSHVTRESAQTDWVGVAHVEEVTHRSQRADHLSRISAGSLGHQNPALWLSRRHRSISFAPPACAPRTGA